MKIMHTIEKWTRIKSETWTYRRSEDINTARKVCEIKDTVIWASRIHGRQQNFIQSNKNEDAK
jgi:hypothetical protein